MWILNTDSIRYKDMLMKLIILPPFLRQERHIFLLLGKILKGKVDISWRTYVKIRDSGTTKNQIICNFSYRAFRLRKCDADVWLRACQMSNICNNSFKMDILSTTNLKLKNSNFSIHTSNLNSPKGSRTLGVCSM